MSTLDIAVPAVEPETVWTRDDDVVHLFCCDPNRAWCGQDITDEPLVDHSDRDRHCELCVVKVETGQPCGAVGCHR